MLKAKAILRKKGSIDRIDVEIDGRFEHLLTEFSVLARRLYERCSEREKSIIRNDWNGVIAPWTSIEDIAEKTKCHLEKIEEMLMEGKIDKKYQDRLDEMIDVLLEQFGDNDDDKDDEDDNANGITVKAVKIDANSYMGKMIKKIIGELEEND